MKDIEAKGDVEGATIKKISKGKINSSMEKIKTNGRVLGPKYDEIGSSES